MSPSTNKQIIAVLGTRKSFGEWLHGTLGGDRTRPDRLVLGTTTLLNVSQPQHVEGLMFDDVFLLSDWYLTPLGQAKGLMDQHVQRRRST